MPQKLSFIKALCLRCSICGTGLLGLGAMVLSSSQTEDDLRVNALATRLSVNRAGDCQPVSMESTRTGWTNSQADVRAATVNVLSSSTGQVWADAQTALSKRFGLCAGEQTALDKENGLLYIDFESSRNAKMIAPPLRQALSWAAAQPATFSSRLHAGDQPHEVYWSSKTVVLRYN